MTESHDSDASPSASAPGRSAAAGAPPGEPETFLRLLGWPPPGLARVQGDLGMVARKTITASSVLVLPLLLVVTADQPRLGMGPFGSAWWIVVITTLLGLALLLDALVPVWRVLRRALRAMDEGYSGYLVGQVLADVSGDGGFLIQGAQEYSMMQPEERRGLGYLRLAVQVAYVCAGLWLSAGFGLLLLLGARGIVTPGETAFWTVAPSVVLIVAGGIARAVDGTLMRRARKAWFKQPWAAELARNDVDEWRDAAARRGLPVHSERGGVGLVLRLSLVAVLIGGLVAILPPVTLVPASSIGTILGLVAPGGRRLLENSARAEAYRGYRLDPSTDVTPVEAGELLIDLMSVGDVAARDGMRGPSTRMERPWFPEPPEADWVGDQPPYWGNALWDMVESGAPRELRDYLRQLVDHPGHEMLARLARAPAMDVLAARYELPFPEEWHAWTVPWPRFQGIQLGVRAHLGVAALHAAEGRADAAVEAVAEVISLGFLLMEESPQEIDFSIGYRIVEMGGDALARLLPIVGRQAEADELAARLATAEAAVAKVGVVSQTTGGPEGFWMSVQAMATAEETPRSIRWLNLIVVSDLAPCMNLQRVVYGPGEDYREWLDTMHSELVRYPSEEAYFDLATRGLSRAFEPNLVTRIFGIAMGGAGSAGSCAQVIGAIGQM